MKRIAKFEKVSEQRFVTDWMETTGAERQQAQRVYAGIRLPRRATLGSAGYDFYAPAPIILEPGEGIKVPTGIRVRMETDWVLQIFPRSGLGFKFRLQMDNTVGIIDSDYYHSDNEGHIFIKMTHDGRQGKKLTLQPGEGFAQGIFLPYGITEDDEVTDVRNGGFGSTTK